MPPSHAASPAERFYKRATGDGDWRKAKVYGFSVLAIIGRWQDRRRPLACYTAACGGLQLRTFASMDMSFITPQIVLVVLVTLVLLVAALVLVTLSLRSD
jgi:hypothetical protein